MQITTSNRLIPLQGDEKTLIQRLRPYIDSVDKGWFSRLQPASEIQIEDLKQQLGLDRAGIELHIINYCRKHKEIEYQGGISSKMMVCLLVKY